MFRKILVAVDGSPITGKVLSAAADLTRHYSSDLHLIYVIERGWPENCLSGELAITELGEEAGVRISEFKTDLATLGVDATVHIKQGHPGEIILGLAAEMQINLIILGSVGKSQMARMLSGSVSTYVVTHSQTDTLVIKP